MSLSLCMFLSLRMSLSLCLSLSLCISISLCVSLLRCLCHYPCPYFPSPCHTKISLSLSRAIYSYCALLPCSPLTTLKGFHCAVTSGNSTGDSIHPRIHVAPYKAPSKCLARTCLNPIIVDASFPSIGDSEIISSSRVLARRTF